MPRPTDWNDTLLAETVASTGQGIASLTSNLSSVDLRGATLIRTILTISMYSSSVSGAWGTQRVNMAIGITSQEAFSAGVVPDPISVLEKPPQGWLWRGHRIVSQNGPGGELVQTAFYDIRGARKLNNGVLFFVVDNSPDLGTAFSVRIRGLARCLIKLS